jgi:hypothetical protein
LPRRSTRSTTRPGGSSSGNPQHVAVGTRIGPVRGNSRANTASHAVRRRAALRGLRARVVSRRPRGRRRRVP